jgi:hypothetical protein
MATRLRAGRPRNGIPFLAEEKKFSPLHNFQTDSGPNLTYTVDTDGHFPGVKRQGREVNHSPPSSAEFKNGGHIPRLPHTSSWRGA